MKKTLFLLIFAAIAYQGLAQNAYRHQFSSAPDTSRLEIVQSDMGARYTFRIDKYTGEVYQLVKTYNDDLAWEAIGVEGVHLDIILYVASEIASELPTEQAAKPNSEQIPGSALNLAYEKVSKIISDQVNFQLFISGSGMRYTFLLHIHTGKTWQLAQDIETEQLFWSAIE